MGKPVMRYVLLERGERFDESNVNLVDGVASIYNPKTDTKTCFTLETYEDHFERFEYFFKEGKLKFCYEIGLGVEQSEIWAKEYYNEK